MPSQTPKNSSIKEHSTIIFILTNTENFIKNIKIMSKLIKTLLFNIIQINIYKNNLPTDIKFTAL